MKRDMGAWLYFIAAGSLLGALGIGLAASGATTPGLVLAVFAELHIAAGMCLPGADRLSRYGDGP